MSNHNQEKTLAFSRHKRNGFKELAIKSVSKKGILLNDIYKIVEEFDKESQREIILEAAKNDGWVMKYPLSGSNWLKDMEIVYTCIKHKYFVLHLHYLY